VGWFTVDLRVAWVISTCCLSPQRDRYKGDAAGQEGPEAGARPRSGGAAAGGGGGYFQRVARFFSAGASVSPEPSPS